MKRRISSGFLLGGILFFLNAKAFAATFNIANGDIAALKSAIVSANSNAQDDTINLAAGGLYILTSVDNATDGPSGLPLILNDGGHAITINGNGAMIQRSTANGIPAFRILGINSGAPVSLVSLTLAHGQGNFVSNTNDTRGGGIYNAGILTVQNCVLSNNAVDGPGSFGGAIFNAATLTIQDCTLNNNSAINGTLTAGGSHGGAIFNLGTLTVTDSTFSGNSTRGGDSGVVGDAPVGGGGAIENDDGTINLTNCTLSGNSAVGGNGIGGFAHGGQAFGGAIESFGDGLILTNCTISGNAATGGSGNFAYGGGISTGPNASTIGNTVKGTIIAKNTINAGIPDVDGSFTSQGFNLIGVRDGSSGFTAATDQTGTNASPLDPKLDPAGLQNNGGPTQTIALQSASSAVDAGDDGVLGPPLNLLTDQRGPGFPRRVSAHVDIGAIEYDGPQAGPVFTVTTTDDHNGVAGVCGSVDCTLREAIIGANARAGDDVIVFAPGMTGTINLISPLPNLSSNIQLFGPGANVLTVQRNSGNTFRIFTVTNGTTTGPRVDIADLTIANGQVTGIAVPDSGGGGILNDHGTMTVNSCTLSGNNAARGGGIYNYGENGGNTTMGVRYSTLTGNTATSGGALYNDGSNNGNATLTATNSSLSGNSATFAAGGILNTGATSGSANLTLRNCTLSGNSAPSLAGGIYNSGSSGSAATTLGNTIFRTGNFGVNLANNTGTIGSQGHNLSSDAAGGASGTGPGGFLNGPADQRNTDPLLDPAGLADNGGLTKTIALTFGSPAINAGDDALAPKIDQRGYLRSGVSDIGAFEFGGQPVRITSITRLANGHIFLQGIGVPSAIHTLDASLDLSLGFAGVGPVTANASGVFQYDDAGAVGLTKRFYRVTFP